MGITRGQTFAEFIRQKLADCEFVIMMITHRYYESSFCLCELGATWIVGRDAMPILVPPLSYDNLKAVLVGVQSGAVNDKRVLNELKDRLTELKIASTATGRWEAKRDEFSNAFPRIQKKLSGPTLIPVAEHEPLKKSYEAAQASVEEKDAKIEELEELIDKLKQCKDRAEVTAAVRSGDSPTETFEQLVADAVSATSNFPDVAREALFYHHRGGRLVSGNRILHRETMA